MFHQIKALNGVQYLRSDFLTCRHGFATRLGGVSREIHTSELNLAFGRGDEDSIVLENLRLFSEAIGIEAQSVISRPQIHSSEVIIADKSMCGEGYFKAAEACDGYVTDCRGVTLGVKTADCVPILMQDAQSNIIGAVHAGWRGTVAGIASNCVKCMCELGAKAERIKVAIGPAIHKCCYEVGEDFFDSVAAYVGVETAKKYIAPMGEKLHADIVGLNLQILVEAGVLPCHIDVSQSCTCCEHELFYSHRYTHGERGTMLSVIAI